MRAAEAWASARSPEPPAIAEGLDQAAVGRGLLPPDGRYVLECRRCGVRVAGRGADPRIARHLARLGDFTVEKISVVFHGTCRDCRERSPG
jgi:hypothetical protein